MEINYYELTSELDPREVLRYLNNLGIHNISGEVLKYFITDLKKLIKYDLQQKNLNHETVSLQGPERLHSASTFSSRIRSKVQDGAPLQCTRECHNTNKVTHVRNIQSAPNLRRQKPEEKPLRRACSCVRVEKKPGLFKDKSTTSTNNNLIKVNKPPVIKKCDPVTLYHYYTSLWNKYKTNVPGENDWSDLRWSIRQKMAGNVPMQVANKVPESQRDKQQTAKS
ncbi:unnamed protein product [Arctia plantaginis]|uniref:Centriolar and ciliogenesis-associated protein HYLS1 C-terminal domain-containing protein n=1 Tax=Arctia plantaginis TaxID=874455 RepID=A0A8S0YWK2_ARCPL|nr:unnamed protein product [Arctia plantaginis]CAB3247499.1 unnamed protein product [Arctia plantaginis]